MAKQRDIVERPSSKVAAGPEGASDPDAAAMIDLIRRLRGSCKGKGSLVKALQHERRREDRIKSRKLQSWGRA